MIIEVTNIQYDQGGVAVYGYAKDTDRPVMCCISTIDAADVVEAMNRKQPVEIDIDAKWVVPVLTYKRRKRAARSAPTRRTT